VERGECLVKKTYHAVSGCRDGGNEEKKDHDDDDDEDSDMVQVSDSMIIGKGEQEDWMEWQDIGDVTDDDDGVESLVDMKNPDMTPTIINKPTDKTGTTDTTNNSKATTSNLNHINKTSSIYIHNHGIVQGIMPFLPSHSYNTANSTNNGTKSTNSKILEKCNNDYHHNYHSHIDVSSFGQSLSQIAISDLSQAGISISTPVAALALAVHSVLCCRVLNFKCTGIPNDACTGKRGFAAPVRELPMGEFLPDGWDKGATCFRCAAAATTGSSKALPTTGISRHHHYPYQYDTDITNQTVSLRYRKDGMDAVVLRVEILSPDDYSDEGSTTASIEYDRTGTTTARTHRRRTSEIDRVERKVRLCFGPIQGERTVMIFPLDRHVSLDGLDVALSSSFSCDDSSASGNSQGGVLPALYYKALATLMTEFCKVMDLGTIHEASLLVEHHESNDSSGALVKKKTTNIAARSNTRISTLPSSSSGSSSAHTNLSLPIITNNPLLSAQLPTVVSALPPPFTASSGSVGAGSSITSSTPPRLSLSIGREMGGRMNRLPHLDSPKEDGSMTSSTPSHLSSPLRRDRVRRGNCPPHLDTPIDSSTTASITPPSLPSSLRRERVRMGNYHPRLDNLNYGGSTSSITPLRLTPSIGSEKEGSCLPHLDNPKNGGSIWSSTPPCLPSVIGREKRGKGDHQHHLDSSKNRGFTRLLNSHIVGGSGVNSGNLMGPGHPSFWQSDCMEDDEEVGGGTSSFGEFPYPSGIDGSLDGDDSGRFHPHFSSYYPPDVVDGGRGAVRAGISERNRKAQS